MSESTMRRNVVKALMPLNGIAVENPVLPGTPDVNYVEGWIELKQLPKWPARKDTIVRIPTYTPQQRVWAIRRRRVGGHSWFMLQVRKEWLLMDGAVAAQVINKATRTELIHHSIAYWSRGLPDDDLVATLIHTELLPYVMKRTGEIE